jgi:hypothetical protein
MWKIIRLISLVASLGISGWLTTYVSGFTERKQGPPSSKTEAGPSPSEILERRGQVKPAILNSSSEGLQSSVAAYINWAAASTQKDRETARRGLAEVRGNRQIGEAFCDYARRARYTDHSRALVTLGLLGEMKGAAGEACFREFLAMPLPTQGTVVDGEIIERRALASLQAKAVDGLAYMRTPQAEEEVLRLAREHPSRIVRAEAINAYLWNHGDSEEAKQALRQRVRQDEEIFVDRVRWNTGEKAESFNRKLEVFLKAHPEAIAPAPTKRKEGEQGTVRDRKLGPPPKF